MTTSEIWLRSAQECSAWLRHVADSAEVAKATRLFGNGRAHGRIALQRAFEPVAVLSAVTKAGCRSCVGFSSGLDTSCRRSR